MTYDLDVIRDMRHLIAEYQAYAERMRAIGRGFYPTGLLGHSVDSILAQADAMLATDQRGEMGR